MSQKSTILVVDDEPLGRRILQVLLADQGYNLVEASNGIEALSQAQFLTPDLILLDIMMPDMDGFEVCQHLRNDPLLAEVPVVMVTALDDRESRLRGIEVGADDFITKPVDRVELRKRVQTIIRLDRYRRLLKERDQRQQAEEAIRRRNRELTLLNNVIMAAASTLDVPSILHIACESLARAFEIPCAMAALLDEQHNQATIAAACISAEQLEKQPELLPTIGTAGSAPASASHAPASLPPLQRVIAIDTMPALQTLLQHKAPLAISNVQHDPQCQGLHDLLQAHQIVSLLMVPILTRERERVVGSITLGTTRPREFKSDEFALAQSIATAVGQTMESAQLYQRLQRYADHLEETVHQRTLELQTERDRTQAILEALGEAVIVINKEGIIQYSNPAASQLTGYSSEHMLGTNWRTLQSDGLPPDVYNEIFDTMQQGTLWSGEVQQKRNDGSAYDAAVTIAPLFDPHHPGSLLGVVTVQRDVTPLKEAQRLKDQFVSNVSHELRTPLSIITLLSGNLDTLYERLDEEKRQKMIRDIREHAKVLNDLISSVLEISRIDSRRISTKYEHLNLVQLAREEVEQQMPLAQKKEQNLSTRGAECLMVWANDGQLRQVIRNLLNNAIKYTPPAGEICCECQIWQLPTDSTDTPPNGSERWSLLGSEPGAVWPGSEGLPPGRWAALRVIDSGVGINSEELPHIFERFYRVQSQGKIPGTGLGLSIAQELINLQDGHIAIASTPGQGSIVAIYLPLAEDTA